MHTLAILPTEILWRNALAVIPLALIVAAICRWLPCRPATRHGLWLTALLTLIIPPLLPGMLPVDRLSYSENGEPGVGSEINDLPYSTVTVDDPRSVDSSRAEVVTVAEPLDTARPVSDASARLAQTADPGGRNTRGERATRSNRRGERARDYGSKQPVPSQSDDAQDAKAPEKAQRHAALPHNDQLRRSMAEKALSESTTTTTKEHYDSIPKVIAESPQPAISPRHQDLIDSENPLKANLENGAKTKDLQPLSIVIDDQRVWQWLAGLVAVQQTVAELPPLPASIWISGCMILVFVSALRAIQLRRRIARSTSAPREIRAMVKEVAETLGLRRVPETTLTDLRVSPFIWCGRRPRLVLPVELWNQLPDESRRAVLFHELAHLKRKDHWVRRWELAIGYLYWWHPVVWWIRHRLENEADACCDAWVTWLMPRGRRAYAEALLRTNQFLSTNPTPVPTVGIGVLSRRAGNFARRLTMVMTHCSKPHLSLSGIGLACALVAAGWLAAPAKSCEPKAEGASAQKQPCDHKKCDHQHPCAGCKDGKPCVQLAKSPVATTAPCTPAPPCAQTPAAPAIARAPRPAMPAPPATPAPVIFGAASPEPMSTFHAHMRSKTAAAPEAVAFAGAGAGHGHAPTPPPPPAPPSPRRRGPGAVNMDPALEERMAKLEAELERLNEHLSHLGENLHGMKGPGPRPGQAIREDAVRNVHRELREKMRQQRKVNKADNDGIIVEIYRLPEGKLEALTALMIRSDVPVRVRPVEGGLEVHATKAQHKAVARFIEIINPGSDKGASSWGMVNRQGLASAEDADDLDADGDFDFDFDFDQDIDVDVDIDDDDADDEDAEDEEDESDDEDEEAQRAPAGFGELAERFVGNFARRMPEIAEQMRAAELLAAEYSANQGDYQAALAAERIAAQVHHEKMARASANRWHNTKLEDQARAAAEHALAADSLFEQQYRAAEELAATLKNRAGEFEDRARSAAEQARLGESRVRMAERYLDRIREQESQLDSGDSELDDARRAELEAKKAGLRDQAELLRNQLQSMQDRIQDLEQQIDRLRDSADALRGASRVLEDQMASGTAAMLAHGAR